jgi:hypothetical protein
MTCCNHQCNEGRDCPEKQPQDFFWLLDIMGVLLFSGAMILVTAYVIWTNFY